MDEKTLGKELKTVFMQEAKERLNSIINCLIEIEQTEDNSKKSQELTDTVFRDMHSMKGAARSINLSHFESFFQLLETLLTDIKEKKKEFTPEISELIQETMNKLDDILQENNIESLEDKQKISQLQKYFESSIENIKKSLPKQTEEKPQGAEEKCEVSEIKQENPQQNKNKETGKKTVTSASETEEKNKDELNTASAGRDTVRITSAKLDSLLLKSENLIRIKQMFKDNSESINRIISQFEFIKHSYNKTQPDLIFLKQFLKTEGMNQRAEERTSIKYLTDFLGQLQIKIKDIENSIRNLGNIEKDNFRNAEKMIDSFLYNIKEVAMLPFSNILSYFPRMVKNISKELKKDVNFKITGEDNQIDRRILQEMKDPLIHLIRNCIDHGIEMPEERKIAGKTEKGNIKLQVFQSESNKIEIEIEDDGKGIDEYAVKNKLINEGAIKDDSAAKMTKDELIDRLFFSGFSTKNIITDISGQGLGLTIVKERLEKLGGKISVTSESEKGTTVKLSLPVALSTFKGVLLEINKRLFAVPSINVEKVIRIKEPSIKRIENRETLVYNDKTYPLVDLAFAFNLSADENNEKKEVDENILTAVILEKNNKFMAIKVDNILEEQEILVKDLGCQLRKIENISGATILTSGEIVPILNIQDLFFTAKNLNTSGITTGKDFNTKEEKREEKEGRKTNNLLVVEDSITSRILLKNILESAGYNVETAVDGVAAVTVLKTKDIDLVVSDIQMPRMDGFALTRKIKADSKLADIPVILVTSLSSDEDKERGVDAGANAYIVKSQFDQSNLLKTIETLT
ncbi:MAG: response regulator [Victivallales bacterium]|nr:response regulator [Victivallales bacterium]